MNFDKLQKYFNTLPKLKLEGVGKLKNIHEIIVKGNEVQTLKEDGGFYCSRYVRRSITDLYHLYCTHVKKVSVKVFYNLLINEVNLGRIKSFICSGTRKRVYTVINLKKAFFNSDPFDEYGVDFRKIGLEVEETTGEFGFKVKKETLKLISYE